MFKVTAATMEEYFTADPEREDDPRSVDKTISDAARTLRRHFFTGTGDGRPGMSMSMIGYGTFQHKVKSSESPADMRTTSAR